MEFEINNLTSELIEETKKNSYLPLEDLLDHVNYDSPYPAQIEKVKLPNMNNISQKDLEQVLLNRKAIRSWSNSVSLKDLGIILNSVSLQDSENWIADYDKSMNIDLLIFANNVENLKKGIYKYDYENHSLSLVSELTKGEMEKFVLQKDFSVSPVIIVFAGKLGAAAKKYGSIVHRRLLVRAGMMGQYAWLKSISLGYNGTTFAGSLQRPLYDYLNIDGYVRAQLFAFAFGK